MTSPRIEGVHFVGSVPVSTAEQCFRTLSTAFPGLLKRLTDGEPGTRKNFAVWQREALKDRDPRLINEAFVSEATARYSEDETSQILRSLDNFETRYDEYALSSYAIFKKLKDEKAIEKNVRFQVCLPTPINVVFICIHSSLRSRVEPIYEQALLQSLKRIQDSIPHNELSIQLDCPVEIGMIESASFYGLMDFQPWFQPTTEGVAQRLVKIADTVAEDVELGIHLCYGDRGGKHFVEPKTALVMVDFANTVFERCNRTIDYIHLPVPKDRTDQAFFAPLEQLGLKNTELVLGLAHEDDVDGTNSRISTASKVVKSFSIATECGLGRRTPEQLNGILSTLVAVSTST